MDPAVESVVLIGFMGAGKSAIARELERLTGLPRYEVDDLITAASGESVSDVFERNGEEAFRELETATLEKLLGLPAGIVDVGGGAVLRNSDLLKRIGRVVWLRVSEDEMWRRVAGRTDRPLLNVADPRARFMELLHERTTMYATATDLAIDTEGRSAREVAAAIARQLNLLPARIP